MADDELPPAIPAATVVLLRDGAGRARDAHVATQLEARVRRWRVGVPGRAHRSRGLSRRRDRPPTMPRPPRPPATRPPARRWKRPGSRSTPTGLIWFAHWTPGALAARRFATWFFMARAPEGAVTVDDGEIHEHQWIRPADAMARRDAGEIEIIPPTWMTLRLLTEESTVDATLAAARARDPQIYVTHIDARRRRHRVDLAGRRGLRRRRHDQAGAPQPPADARRRLARRDLLTRPGQGAPGARIRGERRVVSRVPGHPHEVLSVSPIRSPQRSRITSWLDSPDLRWGRRLVVLVTAVALLAVACSDSGGSDQAQSTTTLPGSTGRDDGADHAATTSEEDRHDSRHARRARSRRTSTARPPPARSATR